MNANSREDEAFLKRLTAIVEANLSDEKFGVNELAAKTGLSRSQIHRRLKKETNKSLSQFIREIRLEKSKELLKSGNFTVSEIAWKVGFGSPSYFIKSFHDYYGYPPGGYLKYAPEDLKKGNNVVKRIFIPATIIGLLLVVFYFAYKPFNRDHHNIEKTIAVLPTYYLNTDSSSSVIDGIALAVYNKLELIQDLTVRPWISVMKYRNSDNNAFEISKELNVNYLVQLVCRNYNQNDFSVNVTLINKLENKSIPISTYKGSVNDDIYLMEDEISKEVTEIINARITPEEWKRMNQRPTKNNTALRYYYEGLKKQNSDAESAVSYFEKAIEEDNKFALAYAELANTYSILDTGTHKGKFANFINGYAFKAVLFDNENDKCLIPAARVLIAQKNYQLAINYLEKATEYNPNSAISYRMLNYLTAQWGIANSEKYLEYALKAVKYNLLEEDSLLKSGDYHRLARAFRGAGFYKEALKNIDVAINLNPEQSVYFTEKCEIILDSTRKYKLAIDLLQEKFVSDSTDNEINLYLFKYYYVIGEFQNAFRFYNKLITDLSYQPAFLEISRFALMFNKLGNPEKSGKYTELYENFPENENLKSTSKIMYVIRLYCLRNDPSNAIEQLRKLCHQNYIFGNHIRYLEDEPIFEELRKNFEFQNIISDMKNKFKQDHEMIKANLKKKGLL